MKALHDRNGLTVHVDLLTGFDHGATVVDGSPYLQRKARLLQGRRKMSSPGHYVHGLDELERELSELPREYDVLPANDAWTARLVTAVDLSTASRQFMELTWYQDGGDPFPRLVELLGMLDFTLYSASEIVPFFLEPKAKVAFGMRPMNDKTGLPLKIEWIRGDYAYAGMLEGTPYLARRLRSMQGRQKMESPGIYVDGLDALDREIAALSHQCEVWAPDERWAAKLVTDTEWPSHVRHYVHIVWFQEGDDPMERLAAILIGLDFMRYSASEIVEPDD